MTHQGRNTRNGVAAVAVTLMLAVSALAHDSEKVLHAFAGNHDGVEGGNHLVADSAGNLYGTTFGGGNQSTSCEVFTGFVGCGVVFELSPREHGQWTERVLYAFTGGADGGVPTGGVILDSAGNLYGTTLFGGDKKPQNCQAVGTYAAGCGVVFMLTPTAHGPWKETALYTFTGGADGSEPWGNPVLDSSGDLYGMTNIGGANSSCGPPYGCGVVFKLTPAAEGPWTESVLDTFSGGSDGAYPFGDGLTFDSQGNLYGVTDYGGDTSVICNGTPGCGVAFQLAPTPGGPWTETVLHAFTGGTDGGLPLAALILDSGGNVYGATSFGGDTAGNNCLGTIPGCGVVFKLTQGTWEETVLYTFTGGEDGTIPLTPVVLDALGNLYGVTTNGGGSARCSNGCGTVFKLTPTNEGPWNESILYAFRGGIDGRIPQSNLLLEGDGEKIFGVTNYGGDDSCDSPYGCGVVFELQPPSNALF
jgi:uncharacterized repeat protein (TIGR03803 family)